MSSEGQVIGIDLGTTNSCGTPVAHFYPAFIHLYKAHHAVPCININIPYTCTIQKQNKKQDVPSTPKKGKKCNSNPSRAARCNRAPLIAHLLVFSAALLWALQRPRRFCIFFSRSISILFLLTEACHPRPHTHHPHSRLSYVSPPCSSSVFYTKLLTQLR